MKITKISAILLAAFVASFAQAGGDSATKIASEMIAKYKKAMINKDISFFQDGSTSDFAFIDTHGKKSSKKTAVDGMKAGFSMMGAFKKFDVKLVSAKNAEGGVVFVVDEDIEHPLKMGGKTSVMTSKARNETLLVKKGGKWVYKRVKILKEDTKVDGKRFDGM